MKNVLWKTLCLMTLVAIPPSVALAAGAPAVNIDA